MDEQYAQELENVRREAEIQVDLNHKIMSNHLAQSAQVIAGIATMRDSDDDQKLLEAIVGSPLP